jgi:hypothetical protein
MIMKNGGKEMSGASLFKLLLMGFVIIAVEHVIFQVKNTLII